MVRGSSPWLATKQIARRPRVRWKLSQASAAPLVALLIVLTLGGCAAPAVKTTAVESEATTAVTAPPPAKPAAVEPAAKPAAVEPAAKPAAAGPPAKAAAVERASKPAPAAPAKPAAPPATTAQAQKPPAAAPTPARATPPPLDLKSLETRLKETSAIGVMTKITLKNQVDDLLDQFRAFYDGKLKTSLAELRRPYDLLILKVLALLQDGDPALASALVASREAIWGILSDRAKFAAI